jgi:hypothetical protein
VIRRRISRFRDSIIAGCVCITCSIKARCRWCSQPPRPSSPERISKGTTCSLGVIPVAVLDRTAGVARRLAAEMGLRYTVLADARQVIAVQFNCSDAGRMLRGCFVIDTHGKVRALQRGTLPAADYPNLCARALGLATPGVHCRRRAERSPSGLGLHGRHGEAGQHRSPDRPAPSLKGHAHHASPVHDHDSGLCAQRRGIVEP